MALLRNGCLWKLGDATKFASLESVAVWGDRRLGSYPCEISGRQDPRGFRVVVECSTYWNFDARRLDGARRFFRGILLPTRIGVAVASASRTQGMTTPRGQSERHRKGFKPQRQPRESSKTSKIEDNTDEVFGEDALEALFAQLEEDLEAGGISDIDDVTEEEFVELEKELEAALLEIEAEEEELINAMSSGNLESTSNVSDQDENGDSSLSEQMRSEQKVEGEANWYDDEVLEDDEELAEDDEELAEDDKELAEDENRIVTLESWQLQKLAAAAELGRRKVNIKALSAEVGLDRFDVLAWLKNPPPELLLCSTTMESAEQPRVPASTANSQASSSTASNADKDEESTTDGKKNWQQQKRLRKDHEATLELVLRKTSRPSNAMIQNLVELTHLPKRKVVEWFEDRRQRMKTKSKFEALRHSVWEGCHQNEKCIRL